MADQKKATLYGLATVLLWSTVASAFKLSLRHLSPAGLLLYSSLFSTLTLAIVLALQGRLGHLKAITWRNVLQSALYGFMNPFLYYLILFHAYALLPAQEAQPLNYTWAVALTLLSVPLLGQNLKPRDLAAVLVSYLGVWVISTRGELFSLSFSSPLGVVLALASTLIWASYWIFNTRDERDPVAGLFMNFLFGSAFVLAWCLLTGEDLNVSMPGLLGAAYVGLFEMGLTFVLWLTAMKLATNTSRIANLIFLSPFLSLMLISLLVGEEIYPSTFAGLVLIMGGLLLQRF